MIKLVQLSTSDEWRFVGKFSVKFNIGLGNNRGQPDNSKVEEVWFIGKVPLSLGQPFRDRCNKFGKSDVIYNSIL